MIYTCTFYIDMDNFFIIWKLNIKICNLSKKYMTVFNQKIDFY